MTRESYEESLERRRKERQAQLGESKPDPKARIWNGQIEATYADDNNGDPTKDPRREYQRWKLETRQLNVFENIRQEG